MIGSASSSGSRGRCSSTDAGELHGCFARLGCLAMWSTVELREIKLFMALAEELHFGRTAERLQLTPSRVSQTLRDLEAKLGGRLVHRTSRHVELTARGERFREEVAELHQ